MAQANVYASVAGTVGRSANDPGKVGVFRRPAETGAWEHVITEHSSNTVFVHPTDPNLVFAGTHDGVYRSTDRGKTFQRANFPDKKMEIWSFLVDAGNPKLVYASISGFGQTGPYAARPGFDQIAQGMGGLMSITGLPGQGPVRVGIPIADLTAGLFCALGILVALLEREKSKQGQHVTTSLLQAQIFMLDFQGARWLIEGDVPKQAGNNHPTSIPTGVFKTADGHINIASTGSKIWARFCAAADASELLQRPEYQTAAERSKNRDALNADIERYTVKQTSAEWIERLNSIADFV